MAGLLGGLFGVGGGFLVIPLLGFFYGMDQQTAQGTALIMVVPNVTQPQASLLPLPTLAPPRHVR